MKNKNIKFALFETNTTQWELAKLLGTSEASLSRKLREELPAEEQKEIVSLIMKNRSESNDE